MNLAAIAAKLNRLRFKPKGSPMEHLALINNEEEGVLRKRGGLGLMTKIGVRSFTDPSQSQGNSLKSTPTRTTSQSKAGQSNSSGSFSSIGSGRGGSSTTTYSGPKGTTALNTPAYTVGGRMNPMQAGITSSAHALGIRPQDLATTISYETGGTFNPSQRGPYTKYGQHKGLIQFGEPQAKQFGVDWKNPAASQLGPDGAIVQYLKNARVTPGTDLLHLYAAINAGGVNNINASDAGNGGAWGTVADKVKYQMAGHQKNAERLLGSPSSSDYVDVASVPSIPPPVVPRNPVVVADRGPLRANPMLPAPQANDSDTGTEQVADVGFSGPHARPMAPMRVAAAQPDLPRYSLTDYPVTDMQEDPVVAGASDTSGGMYGLGPNQTQNVALNVGKRLPGVIGNAMVRAATSGSPSTDPNYSYIFNGGSVGNGRGTMSLAQAVTDPNSTSGVDPVLGVPWLLDPVTGKHEMRGSSRYDELLAAQNPITKGVKIA